MNQQNESNAASAETATFDSLTAEVDTQPASNGDVNLNALLDVPVTISLEVGRTKMTISDLVRLGPGSVVELERQSGEPLDVYVNGTLIARGEVVVVNERFGVRLTDVVSPSDRIKRLGT